MTGTEEARRTELAERLEAVRARIAAACGEAGRSPAEVALTVVTKTFPASDVRLLAGLGVHDVGENRHQEAEAKAVACADLGLRWHFIGSLQSNKAVAVTAYAGVVESVDRLKLVSPLSRGVHERGRVLDCLVQVSLDAPGQGRGRAGAEPGDVPALADALAEAEGVRLRGVMAVAPRDEEPAAAFERLARVAARMRADHPDAAWISAGMSGDLEAAVAAGATHVRTGSAVLGARPPVQ